MTRDTDSSSSLFVVCRPGGEAFLEEEIARTRPDLVASSSRPGLVIFTSQEPIGPEVALDSVFGREFGVSLGSSSEAFEKAKASFGERPIGLSVFPRDEAHLDLSRAVEARLRAAHPFAEGRAPGQLILDVVVAPDEPHWLGMHLQGPLHPELAGGWYDIPLPEQAPSRAYLKLQQAISWSGARPLLGETMIDLGSAPGGACYAMLKRGLDVHGVDPEPMAPICTAYQEPKKPIFVHHRVTVEELAKQELPRRTHWFATGMNLPPKEALRIAERIIVPIKKSLKGAFFNLKLESLEDARELPLLLARIRKFGFSQVRAKQLPAHYQDAGGGQEVMVVAFTERHALS